VQKLPFITLFLLLTSCGGQELIEAIQGKWKISSIKYINNDTTFSTQPENMYFWFIHNNYQTIEGDSVVEYGYLTTNTQGSMIYFHSYAGVGAYKVKNNQNNYQYWESNKKVTEYTIGIEMEKIE